MTFRALAALTESRRSIRTQLILGTIVGLTLVLALFGLFVRFVVAATLLNSIDHTLQDRIVQAQRRPPPPRNLDPNGGPNQPPGRGMQQQDPGPPQDQGPGSDGQMQPPQGPGNFGEPPNQDGEQPQLPNSPDGQGPPPGQDQNRGPFGDDHLSQLALSPADLKAINQEDQLYHPRRFTSDGTPLDRFGAVPPWDRAAIQSAAIANKPVYSNIVSNGVSMRVLTEPAHSPDGTVWYFQAPYPLAEMDRAIDGVDRALFALIPIALLFAAFVGAFLTRSVLSRVGQMVQTAGGISASDLSQRLDVVGRDEFANLAETFNALLTRVEIAFLEQSRIVEQQRRFTADASHELKTPLTIIRGTTSLALSGNGTLDRQSTVDIDNAAASMSGLVQDLIYLARADAGQLGRKRIDILLVEPLQRAIDRITPLSEAPIKLMAANENVIVNADENEMVRLFSNVLQNAALHTPKDGRIVVSLSSTSDEAVVLINDSGIGIAPQHIEHLGERFYRVDSSRTRSTDAIGGSGLGLAICLGIIEAHEGKMNIESVLGKGTTVTITMPRVKSNATHSRVL